MLGLDLANRGWCQHKKKTLSIHFFTLFIKNKKSQKNLTSTTMMKHSPNNNNKKKLFHHMLLLLTSLLFAERIYVTEARTSFLSKKPTFYPDITISTTSSSSSSSSPHLLSTSSTNTQEVVEEDPSTSTELKQLVHDFKRALGEVNNNNNHKKEDDIHVGNLLSACERLETTIRNIGFGHSANDMANNIAKIRNTYTKVPMNVRNSMPALLQYELDMGMHQNNKIKEVSAANGFLWLGRSVSFFFSLVVVVHMVVKMIRFLLPHLCFFFFFFFLD